MSIELKHYQTEFQTFQGNGATKSPAWVNDLRTAALTQFSGCGFPTTKQEDWKYTNVAAIANAPFRYSSTALPVPADVVKRTLIDGAAEHRIVFVNGHLSAEHSSLASLPAGVTVKNLIAAYATHAEVIQAHMTKYAASGKNPFTALNTAFLNDGAFVHIAAGVAVEQPIHLLFLSAAGEAPVASHIRNLIVAGAGAKVRILHSFHAVQQNTNLTNAVTEVIAAKDAVVELVKVQRESDTSYHVENVHVHQYEHSTVHIFSLAVGGAIARNDMSVIIDGESTECNLNGLYITSGEQLIDHHTFMHHIHPNCPSHELFKGILLDKSRAVFNGKVYVEPEAQKTDSKQTNRNLLLSDDAIVDTKPELEIFADDVKCTHGAAVGGMNEVHSFYLKTRGISEASARGILTVGFAAEATQKIVDPVLRHHADVIVVDQLRSKFGTDNLPDIVHN